MDYNKKLNVAVMGGGQIGSAIFHLLGLNRKHTPWLGGVIVYDKDPNRGCVNDNLVDIVQTNDVFLSALPFEETVDLAKEVSTQGGKLYLDLTEDLVVGSMVEDYAYQKHPDPSIMISHCGLAPGAVSIIASDLISRFETVETVKIRVGALPVNANNPLHYCRSWSTDGLINEYLKPGEALVRGKKIQTRSLDGLEPIRINGSNYECFNTSGGSGTLLRTFEGTDISIDYKTIRHPGHCEAMRLLLWDLFVDEPDIVMAAFDRRIPVTKQDVVVTYIEVVGYVNGRREVASYVNEIYGENGLVSGVGLTAIQKTTAGGMLAVLDTAVRLQMNYTFRNEDLNFDDVVASPFWRPFID